MRHFVAYHNVEKMGYDFDVVDDFMFMSNKAQNFLIQTIGERVWVISGRGNERRKKYVLRAVFEPEQVVDVEDWNFSRFIYGSKGAIFDLDEDLNNLDWFHDFLKSQSNFSIGLTSVKHQEAIDFFESVLTEVSDLNDLPQISDQEDLDESHFFALEGGVNYGIHLRRERNAGLIAAKKELTLRRFGCLACEVCGFDFFKTYGDLGYDFCEVHHKKPLSESQEDVLTTASDLAVVCSNCHRMLHRATPAMDVDALKVLIKNSKQHSFW